MSPKLIDFSISFKLCEVDSLDLLGVLRTVSLCTPYGLGNVSHFRISSLLSIVGSFPSFSVCAGLFQPWEPTAEEPTHDRFQMVMELTMHDWQELIEAYNITRSTIAHRPDHTAAAAS